MDSLAGPAAAAGWRGFSAPARGAGSEAGPGPGRGRAGGGRAGGAEEGVAPREAARSGGRGGRVLEAELRAGLVPSRPFHKPVTADWRRSNPRAALEVCVSLRPVIAPKPATLARMKCASRRRRHRRRRRPGRSPPSLPTPPSRLGRGRGRAGACEGLSRCGARPGAGAGPLLSSLCAGPRSGGTQARPPASPAARLRPEAEEGHRGTVWPALGGVPTGSILSRKATRGGGGRGPDPPSPDPAPSPRPGPLAGIPGGAPAACPPAREGGRGDRFVCCPGTPGAARRRWARAGARAWAERVGGCARGRPRSAGGTDRSAERAGARGQPAYLRRGGSQVPGRKEWISFPRSLVYVRMRPSGGLRSLDLPRRWEGSFPDWAKVLILGGRRGMCPEP